MTAHQRYTEQEDTSPMNNVVNLSIHKLRTHPMSNNPLPKLKDIPFNSDICRADSDLFAHMYTPLEEHVINCAPFLSYEESLHCAPSDLCNEHSEHLNCTLSLHQLWKRSRVATCSAVMEIWIKENPTEYLNFTASGKRLGDYISSIGVKVK